MKKTHSKELEKKLIKYILDSIEKGVPGTKNIFFQSKNYKT